VSSVQAQCNILCYEEPKCVAFNFRTRTNVENCQLTHVTKTKNVNENILARMEIGRYFTMLKRYVIFPNCKEIKYH
jgi:predicted transcriptional regulator